MEHQILPNDLCRACSSIFQGHWVERFSSSSGRSTLSNRPRHEVSSAEGGGTRTQSWEREDSSSDRDGDRESVGQSDNGQDNRVDVSMAIVTFNQLFSHAEASENRSPIEGLSEHSSQIDYDDDASEYGDENFSWDDNPLSDEQTERSYGWRGSPAYIQTSLTANADGSFLNLPLHHSLEDLQISASNRCRLCTLIW